MADGPVYGRQALAWAWTLLDLAHVPADRIVVRALETSSADVRRQLEALGIETITVPAFAPGFPHCNKLRQLEDRRFKADTVTVLTDTDIAFADRVDDLASPTAIRAKAVDLPHPPLALWRSVFQEAGMRADSALTRTSLGDDPTPIVNCNGGIYSLPGWAVVALSESWPRWARWLIDRPSLLPGGYTIHIDQISFGLAILEGGLVLEGLSLEANCPTHVPDLLPDVVPRVLHYHGRTTPSGLLMPVGRPQIDRAISRVNDVIVRRLRDAGGNRRGRRGTSGADHLPETRRFETVHGRFVAIAGDLFAAQFESFGGHTRNELAMVLSFVESADLVVDVGAHIGSFAVPIAQRVGDAGLVIAVEPDPINRELLHENIASNDVDSRVVVTDDVVALSGTGYRAVPADANTGAVHFVRGEGADTRPSATVDEIVARHARLADLRLLKIDVEGMELSALESATATIDAARPLIYCEVAAAQLARYGTSVADLQDFFDRRRYALFKNRGERNSTHDRFDIGRLARLEDGGVFFDCLAIPVERVDALTLAGKLPSA